MKKVVIIVLLLVGALVVLALAGPIVSTAKSSIDLPGEYLEAIESQANGFYSSRLPLLPLWVDVREVRNDRVYYTIRYFPFGTVGMSYSSADGYNCEKTLTRLQ